MTNFILDATGLPFPKQDVAPLPPGAKPSQWAATVDWNTVCQALIDVQTFCRGAPWLGLTGQTSDPAPAGVTDYLWLNTTSNQVYVTINGVAQLVGYKPTVQYVVHYTITGSEANAGLDFFVPIGTTLASSAYDIFASTSGVANAPVWDFPSGGGNRTTSQFRVTLAKAMTPGDALTFYLFAP